MIEDKGGVNILVKEAVYCNQVDVALSFGCQQEMPLVYGSLGDEISLTEKYFRMRTILVQLHDF